MARTSSPAPLAFPVSRTPAGLLPSGPRLIRFYPPAPSRLSYLSWGSRRYGEIPVREKKSPGWHYFLSLSGAPVMIANGRRIVTEPGTLTISHPSCEIGHIDRAGANCEMLTWIWQDPPSHSALQPTAREAVKIRINNQDLKRLKKLHAQTRDALGEASELNTLRLRTTRMLLDLCAVEAVSGKRVQSADHQLEQAANYIREHLAEPLVIESLRDYLQTSKASLYRLFSQDTGKGPRAFVQELRMQWAKDKLLTSEQSVKSVAYALGYRHPPDFSRAFKQHFGMTPTDCTESRVAAEVSA